MLKNPGVIFRYFSRYFTYPHVDKVSVVDFKRTFLIDNLFFKKGGLWIRFLLSFMQGFSSL